MNTERITSLDHTAQTIAHLTAAYHAVMLELVNHSELDEKRKRLARISINNEDILSDVVFEFEQYKTELKIDAAE